MLHKPIKKSHSSLYYFLQILSLLGMPIARAVAITPSSPGPTGGSSATGANARAGAAAGGAQGRSAASCRFNVNFLTKEHHRCIIIISTLFKSIVWPYSKIISGLLCIYAATPLPFVNWLSWMIFRHRPKTQAITNNKIINKRILKKMELIPCFGIFPNYLWRLQVSTSKMLRSHCQ